MHAEADASMPNASIETQTDVACYPVEWRPRRLLSPARQDANALRHTPTGPSPLIYILPAGFGLVLGTMLGPVDRAINPTTPQ